MSTIKQPDVDGNGTATPDMQKIGEDHGTPGHQERTLTEEERLEKSLEDSFPTSDPIQPSRIDGPNT